MFTDLLGDFICFVFYLAVIIGVLSIMVLIVAMIVGG